MPRRRTARSSEVPPAALRAMIRAYLAVLRVVHAQATAKYVQDAAQSVKIPKAVERLVDQATRSIQSSADADLEKIEGIDMGRVAGGARLVDSFRKRNVRLIKTIATEHLDAVEATVKRWGHLHVAGLQKKLQETFQVSASRARFWARDQTLKLHADVVRTKHESLGIVEYVWRTSRDGSVRETHAALHGKTFRYDDPPETGTGPHNPGQDYQCRCHADPVLPSFKAQPKPKPKPKPLPPIAPKPLTKVLPPPTKPSPVAPPPPTPKPQPPAPSTPIVPEQQRSSAWLPPAATLQEAIDRLPGRDSADMQLWKRTVPSEAFRARAVETLKLIADLDNAQVILGERLGRRAPHLAAIQRFSDTEYGTIRAVERRRAGRSFERDAVLLRNTERVARAERDVDRLAAAHRAVVNAPRAHAGQALYRGVRYTDTAVRELLLADEIDFGGSASTSLSFEIAASHFGQIESERREAWTVVFEIVNSKSGIYIDPIAEIGGEQEVLFSRDATFRIRKVERLANHRRAIMVQLEEI